jgi:iron complex transport system ATP-binding protein
MAFEQAEAERIMSIALNDVSFGYGSTPVIKNASFVIERGKALSILGPNGAGKTTLLSVLTGLLAPSSGEILFDGKNLSGIDAQSMALLIGYVPQVIVPAFDYSVLDYVVTGCAPRIKLFSRPKREHYEAAMEAICEMGIEHIVQKSYMRISGGERQQASLARVIAQKPQLILMDEPTAHLDYGNQIRVLNIIKRLSAEGFGIVFTTHNPDHVLLLGGKAAVMTREGCLTFGSAEELIDEGFLTELYKTELRVSQPVGAQRKICYSPGLKG